MFFETSLFFFVFFFILLNFIKALRNFLKLRRAFQRRGRLNYKFLLSTGMYNKIAKQIRDCQLCNDNFCPLIVNNKAIAYSWQFNSSVFKRKDRNKLVSAAISNTRRGLFVSNE